MDMNSTLPANDPSDNKDTTCRSGNLHGRGRVYTGGGQSKGNLLPQLQSREDGMRLPLSGMVE